MVTKLSSISEWDYYLNVQKQEFGRAFGKKISAEVNIRGDFEFVRTLAKGTLSRVYFAKRITTGDHFTIKVIKKSTIVQLEPIDQVKNEIKILMSIDFCFCVKLEHFYMDNSYLYLVMPLIRGGDLFHLLRRKGRLKEPLGQFYGAQMLLALEYLHHLSVIFRDLKPENILIDEGGYLKLADFGFSKVLRPGERAYSQCGTAEYQAPEMLLSQGYGLSSDWWAYGILLYEMAAGGVPFRSENPLEIYDKVLQVRYRCPQHFSPQLRDLVANLLQRDTKRRFGCDADGVKGIKTHSWFKSIDFLAVFNKTAVAPFLPKLIRPTETRNFCCFKETELAISEEDIYSKEFETF